MLRTTTALGCLSPGWSPATVLVQPSVSAASSARPSVEPDAETEPPPAGRPARLVPASCVTLQDELLAPAQGRNLAYLLALDPARLLAPFRRSAGLKVESPGYGSWESTGLDGHMGGHVVSALAQAAALPCAPRDRARVRQRLRQMLSGWAECQQAVAGDALMAGYLGGVPQGREAWAALAQGQVDADNFQLNGRWVPWYNLHKTLAGLRDAWLLAEEPNAEPLLLSLLDWVDRITAGLDEASLQKMLRTEHGGMVEVLADVARVSGDAAHTRLALRFVDRSLLSPLAARVDALTGLHANTQLPKVQGWVRLADLQALPEGAAASRYFWHRVVRHRSVPLGGHGVREHFHPPEDFSPLTEAVEGPESCNSYNMMLLDALLWQQGPWAGYMDHAERTLYNQVLPAQHPVTGGLVYFTPLRPHHHRVYSTVHEGMWCCVGTGLEAHARHGHFIYGHDARTVWVNLFVASTLRMPGLGLGLQQITAFPAEARTTLRWLAPHSRWLAIRHPAWADAASTRVRCRGHQVSVQAAADGYLHLPGPWRAGDDVEIEWAMPARLVGLPDGSAQRVLMLGPVVLATRSEPALAGFAATGGPSHSHRLSDPPPQHFGDDSRMGHMAHGPLSQPEATLVLRRAQALLTDLQAAEGGPLHRRTQALTPLGAAPHAQATVTLEPFYGLHEARYQLLWPLLDGPEVARRAAQAQAQAHSRAALDAQTIDQVAPGEQQPEADHAYAAEGAETGLNQGRRWRHATGWFGYTLHDPLREARALQLVLNQGDQGRRWHVEVNGVRLPWPDLPLSTPTPTPTPDEVITAEGWPTGFVTVRLPLPRHTDTHTAWQVRFVAEPGSVAGGLYGLRLLR